MTAPDRDPVLAAARALAALYGAELFCRCGRDWIGDDGTCSKCVQDAEDRSWPGWSLPGHPFARTGGECLHTRDCSYVVPELDWHQPLTPGQAEAFLRELHDHRRCTACAPDIPEPTWVRVRSPGGQVRWHLADDLDPGEAL